MMEDEERDNVEGRNAVHAGMRRKKSLITMAPAAHVFLAYSTAPSSECSLCDDVVAWEMRCVSKLILSRLKKESTF